MDPSYLELLPFSGPDSVSPAMGRGEGFAALHFRMGTIGFIQVGVGIWGAAKQFSSSFSKRSGNWGAKWFQEAFQHLAQGLGSCQASGLPYLGLKYPKLERLSLVETDTLPVKCLYLLSHLWSSVFYTAEKGPALF